MVEGAVKQYQACLCDPGLSWSRPGNEHIIRIRTAILGGHFAGVWEKINNSPRC